MYINLSDPFDILIHFFYIGLIINQFLKEKKITKYEVDYKDIFPATKPLVARRSFLKTLPGVSRVIEQAHNPSTLYFQH